MGDADHELMDLHLKVGDMLFLQGKMEEASRHFARAESLGADAVRCSLAMGLSSISMGRYGDALPVFAGMEVDESLPRPIRCIAAINAGVCAIKTDDPPACLSHMDKALGLFGDGEGVLRVDLGGLSYLGSRHMIHFTSGTAHEMLGDFDSAVDSFEAAMLDESGGAANGLNVNLAKVELAYCRIKTGRMDRRAWEMHEGRWWTGRIALERVIDPPIRFGDPTGKVVMVYSEQGYGDSIQFVRFARGLKRMGARRVVFVTHPPLARLLSRVEGVDELAVSGQSHSPYDMHVPVMSLPFVLGLHGGLGEYSSPYLSVDQRDSSRWASALPEGLKIGLVWAGDPKKEHADYVRAELEKRNISLRSLVPPLMEAIGGRPVSLVSLQKDDRGSELADFPFVVNPMGGVGDYYDTAALVSNLDMVIAVDTSVAHLAGGMGKPVWMLSRYKGCWRWGREGACLAKVWYPSMEIYRESEYDNWAPTVSSLAGDLSSFLDRTLP